MVGDPKILVKFRGIPMKTATLCRIAVRQYTAWMAIIRSRPAIGAIVQLPKLVLTTGQQTTKSIDICIYIFNFLYCQSYWKLGPFILVLYSTISCPMAAHKIILSRKVERGMSFPSHFSPSICTPLKIITA